MNFSNKTSTSDLGLLLLRIGIGTLMLFHGLHKLINGHEFIKSVLNAKGLPDFLWIGVPFAEVLAPLLIIFGVFSRISSLLIATVMINSIYLAFGAAGFGLTEHGGLVAEFNIFFIFASISLFLTGPGNLSLYKTDNRWLK